MQENPDPAVTLSEAAQTTIRMLIASYFIAAASGTIPGADTGALFSAIIPAPLDRIVGSSLVLIFAVMVMIGAQTRLAALLLGLMTFYASYLNLIEQGVAQVLGVFWRDMALIAALMLTYGGNRRQARARLGLHLLPENTVRASRLSGDFDTGFSPAPRQPRGMQRRDAMPPDADIENIFAEDGPATGRI